MSLATHQHTKAMRELDSNLVPYVIGKAQTYGDVTPMKLQKLLYYVKVWSLVDGHPLVQADFKKWEYGPVNPDLWRRFQEYGDAPIPREDVAHSPSPTGYSKRLADFILNCYGPFSALSLSAMTHKEAPWRETPKNAVIPEQAMHDYYSTQWFAKNFPLGARDDTFYTVQSDFQHSFQLDMNARDAEVAATYESYESYLKQLQEGREELNSALDLFSSL